MFTLEVLGLSCETQAAFGAAGDCRNGPREAQTRAVRWCSTRREVLQRRGGVFPTPMALLWNFGHFWAPLIKRPHLHAHNVGGLAECGKRRPTLFRVSLPSSLLNPCGPEGWGPRRVPPLS